MSDYDYKHDAFVIACVTAALVVLVLVARLLP